MVIFLDSSIYIDLIRGLQDPRQVLFSQIMSGNLYTCGLVRTEVLRGIRQPKVLAEMREFFDIIPEVPMDAAVWNLACEIGVKLGQKGKWPSVSTLAIAACAMKVSATLITKDKNFAGIEGLSLAHKLP